MHAGFTRKRLITCLLAIPLSAGCSEPARSLSPTVTIQPATSQANLPEWLQQGPADWSDEVWQEFQASLIKMRAPLLRAQDYSSEELQVYTAEVEHFPGEYEDKIKEEWLDKWRSRLDSFERTGGCGCCNEIYTVTGPKAAIEEFPNLYREASPAKLSVAEQDEGMRQSRD